MDSVDRASLLARLSVSATAHAPARFETGILGAALCLNVSRAARAQCIADRASRSWPGQVGLPAAGTVMIISRHVNANQSPAPRPASGM